MHWWPTLQKKDQRHWLAGVKLVPSLKRSEVTDCSSPLSILIDLEYEPAQKCAEEAVRLSQATNDKVPPNRQQLHSSLAKDLICKNWTTLAYILRLRGRYSEAAPYYEKALTYLDNKTDVVQRELAQNINSLAILYRMMGKFDKAEPLYKRALSIRQSLFGARHEDIAQSMNSLGCLNQDMGRSAPPLFQLDWVP